MNRPKCFEGHLQKQLLTWFQTNFGLKCVHVVFPNMNTKSSTKKNLSQIIGIFFVLLTLSSTDRWVGQNVPNLVATIKLYPNNDIIHTPILFSIGYPSNEYLIYVKCSDWKNAYLLNSALWTGNIPGQNRKSPKEQNIAISPWN